MCAWCVDGAVAGAAEGDEVVEDRDAVVTVEFRPEVNGERLGGSGGAATSAGAVVAVDGCDTESLPCCGGAAAGTSLLVAASVVCSLTVGAEASAWLGEAGATLGAEAVEGHEFGVAGGGAEVP